MDHVPCIICSGFTEGHHTHLLCSQNMNMIFFLYLNDLTYLFYVYVMRMQIVIHIFTPFSNSFIDFAFFLF